MPNFVNKNWPAISDDLQQILFTYQQYHLTEDNEALPLQLLHKEDLTAQACAIKTWHGTLHKDLDAKTGADISTETGATISIKRRATISTKREATFSTKREAGDLNLELFCLHHLLLFNCLQHQQDLQYHYLVLNKRFLPYLLKKYYQFRLNGMILLKYFAHTIQIFGQA